MSKKMLYCLLSLIVLLLAACTSERIVLLPSPDGKPSAVVVRDSKGKGESVLDQPYAATARRMGENKAYQSTPEEVKERFAAALAAQPARPHSYVLYFQEGGSLLTSESQAELERVMVEIRAQEASEVMVIGHTDSVGSISGNDTLSLKRAASIRQMLIDAGIAAEKLEAVGRGKRDLLVPTADGVAEAKNRRVEINLR